MLVVDIPHTVFNDGGVAVSKLIILVDKILLICLIAFGGVFLRLEYVVQLTGLVSLGEGTLCKQSTLILESLRLLFPSMMIWRTFIFSFCR